MKFSPETEEMIEQARGGKVSFTDMLDACEKELYGHVTVKVEPRSQAIGQPETLKVEDKADNGQEG